VAKTEKQPADKPAAGEPSDGKDSGLFSKVNIILACALAAAVLAGGYVFFVKRGADTYDPDAAKKDPDIAELMKPGELPDMSIGSADAPNVIVEYASMTCPHCAQYDKVVFPEFKTKYIDTGKARLIFREFPLDGLAARASMLARCAGPDRYFAMIDAMFQSQESWVVEGPDALDRLLQLARQAGFSKEKFDECLADKELFKKIVDERQRAHDKFGVDSTPSFFVNGKRLAGEHQVKDFEALMTGVPKVDTSAAPAAGGTPPAEGSATPQGETPAPAQGGAPAPEGGQPAGTPAQ
jgi:protein-disulfide isomerase